MQYNYTQCKITLCRQIVPNGVVLQTNFSFGIVFIHFPQGCCFERALHVNTTQNVSIIGASSLHATRGSGATVTGDTSWYRHLHWRFGHAWWSRWSTWRFTRRAELFQVSALWQ